MKIYTGTPIAQFESNNYRAKADLIKKTDETGFLKDRITIGTSPEEIKEKAIIGQCAGKVLSEVRTNKSEERLEMLKQQVADGTYRPDAERIANKILLNY